MRKVVVTELLSLDGVMAEPAWTAPYWGDDIAQFKAGEMDAGALLLGAGHRSGLRSRRTRPHRRSRSRTLRRH